MSIQVQSRRGFLVAGGSILLAGPLAACNGGGVSSLPRRGGEARPESGLRTVRSGNLVQLLDSRGVAASGTRAGSSLILSNRAQPNWNVDIRRALGGSRVARGARGAASASTPLPLQTSLRLPNGARFGFSNVDHSALRMPDGTLMQFRYSESSGQTRYSGGIFGSGILVDSSGNVLPGSAPSAHGRSTRDMEDDVDPLDWPDGGEVDGIGTGPIGTSSGSYPPNSSGGGGGGDAFNCMALGWAVLFDILAVAGALTAAEIACETPVVTIPYVGPAACAAALAGYVIMLRLLANDGVDYAFCMNS